METTEEWRAVEGFPNCEVSSLGRVRSLFRGGCRVRAQYRNENGYMIVGLQNKRLKVHRRVHVLVMAAFVGPKPERMDVNHIDGCKQNNRPDNLEYMSRSDNHRHAFRLGLAKSPFQRRGEKHCRSILKDCDVIALRNEFTQGQSRRDLSARYGVSYYTVWDITTRRSWTHI